MKILWLTLLMWMPVAGDLDDPPQTPPEETLRKVWYQLGNGLEVGILPLPSLLSESSQEISIITVWHVGSHHDVKGYAGMTRSSAHSLLHTNGSNEGVRREIQAGSRHTWFIDKVHPSGLIDHLKHLASSLEDPQVDSTALQRAHDQMRKEDQHSLKTDIDQLTMKIIDRLDPLASGPRSNVNYDQIEAEAVSAFVKRTFHPGTVTIVIAGPYQPDPVIDLIENRFATIPGKKAVPAPPVPVPVPGELPTVAASGTDSGVAARGWRVPRPGTLASLPLGIFIPRANRALEIEGGNCFWNPILEPDVVVLRQPILPTEATVEQRITRARYQLQGTTRYALDHPVSGEILLYSRSNTAITLGAYRVHDPTSMRDPYPAAESLMLRRVYQMNEDELRNNFGRFAEKQLADLKRRSLDIEKSVSGIISP